MWLSKTTIKAARDDPADPRGESKSAAIGALLRPPNGARLDDLVQSTGWQKHTARAALTGLKKKGHTIEPIKVDGLSYYRITSAANQRASSRRSSLHWQLPPAQLRKR